MRPMPPEDPWDAWRKRAMRDFPDFFADFEKEFARMQGMMNRILEDAMKHASSPQRGEPFVYGFSMRVGPNGIPHIQPFGSAVARPGADVFGTSNAAKNVPEVGLQETGREPLTDVIVGESDVAITVELPGVEKQDVNLHVAEDVVTVRADKGRRYAKRIQLPVKVVASSAKATFKNGILDVTLQRQTDDKTPGHHVAID